MPMPWEQDYGGSQAPAAPGTMPWEKDYASESAEKGFFQRLSEGEYPALYNPKAKLFPGPTGKPPRPMGLDLPTFAEGMGDAPGVTLAGAAAPFTPGAAARGVGAAGKVIFGGHEANAAQWVARLIAGGGGEEAVKALIKHLTASLSGK